MNRAITGATVGLALLVLAPLSGCVTALPKHPWTDAPSALAVMARRADSIRTFSSPCTISVKRMDGYTVSLDGAIAARIPGFLRIRAWKFGDAVLDLTVTPDGVWALRRNRDASPSPGTPEAGPDRLAEVWTLFTGRFFDDPGALVNDQGGSGFTVQRPLGDGGGTVVCEIDRASLTARSYVITDTAGVARLTLTLDRYRLVGQTPWPSRLVAEVARPIGAGASRTDDPARVTIRFDEAEINPDLPQGAFVPPRRAVKRP